MGKKKNRKKRLDKSNGQMKAKSYTPTNDKRAAKKNEVLGTGPKKSNTPLIIMAVCAVLIIGAAVFILSQKGSTSTPVTANKSSGVMDTAVTFPANIFEDGRARHYEHVDGKFTIRFFVLKSSDGIIRAAYDACDVCWPAGKGYYQDGDHMVCRNCGRRFASVLVNEVKGGCNPAPLNRTVKDGKVIIQVKDIREGRRYFNFS
jgi:uncharacterized membrane protein